MKRDYKNDFNVIQQNNEPGQKNNKQRNVKQSIENKNTIKKYDKKVKLVDW